MNNGSRDRRRWLARLGFSFLIIALWLFWIGYQGSTHHTLSGARILLCYVAAFLGFSLFLWGTRERHRRE